MMGSYFERMKQVAERHGGTTEKFNDRADDLGVVVRAERGRPHHVGEEDADQLPLLGHCAREDRPPPHPVTRPDAPRHANICQTIYKCPGILVPSASAVDSAQGP